MEAMETAMREEPRRLTGTALRGAMLALMLTLLLEALDQTIVGTAMPRIIGQLHGLDRYSWAVTAYLLAGTTLIPIAGKLSDQIGRKRFLLAGTFVFLCGSLLCGLAQTIDQLIIFRALQGAGAGTGIALVFTAVGDLVPPVERGKWLGIVSSVYAISAVSGPTVGGLLADHGPVFGPLITDTGRWRWVFSINIPLGLVALAGLAAYLPSGRPTREPALSGWAVVRRIDVAGALLAAAATLSLLLGLTWGGAGAGLTAWGSWRVIGALVGAALLYGALLVAERRAVEPVIPLDLFHGRVFAANAALSLLLNMALLGMAFYVPLFLQGVLGASATQAGATMTPFSVSIAAAGFLAGLAGTVLGRYQGIALLGAALMTLGLFLLTRMTPETALSTALLDVTIAGIGMGALFNVVGVVALNATPPAQMGAGAAVVRYLGQIGGTIGVALVATVVNSSLVDALGRRLPLAAVRRLTADGATVTLNPQVLVNPTYRASLTQRAIATATGRVPAGPSHARLAATVTRQARHLVTQMFDALRLALADAILQGLVVTLVVAGAALLVTVFLKDRPMGPGRAPPQT